MMIDVDTWRDAHEYHREQLGLHHLALHGWGVVQGLDVQLVDNADNTLRIDAGLAVDSAGRFVVVPQAQTYQITARERQLVYLVLQFRDILANPSAGALSTRVIEAYRIQERDRLPEEPYIELARIDLDPAAGKVTVPKDPERPGRNEVDVRSRPYVGVEGTGHQGPEVQLVPRVDEGADGLGPRVDELGQRVGALDYQLRQLASQVETARLLSTTAAPFQPVAPTPTAPAEPSDSAPPPIAAGASSTLTFEQVSRTVAEHVSAVALRVDTVQQDVSSLGHRTDAVQQETAALGQRTDSELSTVGARVDGLRHEVDALGLQVQAISRQVDAFATPAPIPIPATVLAPIVAARRQLRVGLAEHGAAGWDAHREGLGLLVRDLSSLPDVASELVDRVRLGDAASVEVLYLSGYAALILADTDVEAIRRLLEQGGTIIGEGCASGPAADNGSREFAMSFVELANRLGRQLARVDRQHPLMQVRHVFAEVPLGSRAAARVLEAGGLVYSDSDYGCAWQGGPANHPLPRAAIRDAIEFGVNLAVFRAVSR
jgi:hypothetical protein